MAYNNKEVEMYDEIEDDDVEIIYEPKGFLEEEPGRKSSMRAMSFIALFASIMFGIISLLFATADTQQTGIFLTFGFLLAAFAPKALQKFAETKV
jgi:hypothetical protein